MRHLLRAFLIWLIFSGAALAFEPARQDWTPSRAQVEQLEKDVGLEPCPPLSGYVRNYIGQMDAGRAVIVGYWEAALNDKPAGIYMGLPDIVAAADEGCRFIVVRYDTGRRRLERATCSNDGRSGQTCHPYWMTKHSISPLVRTPPAPTIKPRPPQ
jgi:hypothetical protein